MARPTNLERVRELRRRLSAIPRRPNVLAPDYDWRNGRPSLSPTKVRDMQNEPTPGTRVRLRTPCVWPERAGCEGVIVAAPSGGRYPQATPSEVLVLLDDDPLRTGLHAEGRWWTCAIGKRDVEMVA